MRERLIKLLKDACRAWGSYLSMCIKIGEVPNVGFDEFLADCLLQDGVIVLPCKFEDKLYDISEFVYGEHSPEMYEYKADYITLWKKYPDRNEIYFSIDGMDYTFDDFGKTVLLTKEEAEQALKEGGQGCVIV